MKYTRLPGKKAGFYRRWTLWIGEDHLLSVESNIYSEHYKRFHFKDIQAFIVRRTVHGLITNIILTILACLSAFVVVMYMPKQISIPAILTWAVLPCGILVMLLINLVKGATCTCHVKMPLTVHELPSLWRIKHVDRMLAQIRPRVEAVQGRLSVDKIQATTALTAPGPLNSIPSFFPREEILEYGGGAHWFLFGLLIVEAGLTLLRYEHGSLALTLVNMASGIALFVLIIIALRKQKARAVPSLAKTMTRAALAVCTAGYLLSYVYASFLLVKSRNMKLFDNEWAMVSALAEVERSADPFLSKVDVAYAAATLLCGVTGLLAMAFNRQPHVKRTG